MSLSKAKLKKKLIEKALDNPVLSSVCHQVGVGRATVYRWMDEDPTFKKALKQALEKGREAISDFAESNLLRLAKSSNETVALNASKFILTHNSRFYGSKHAIESEDRIDGITITIVPGRNPENNSTIPDS